MQLAVCYVLLHHYHAKVNSLQKVSLQGNVCIYQLHVTSILQKNAHYHVLTATKKVSLAHHQFIAA